MKCKCNTVLEYRPFLKAYMCPECGCLVVEKSKTNYVNKKRFLELMKSYKESGQRECPDAIGDIFLKIAINYAKKQGYRTSGYVEDMIMDGVLSCLKYMHNFDPDVYDNPFAYFTQIIKHSFYRRFNKEETKKETRQKYEQHYEETQCFTRKEGGVKKIVELDNNNYHKCQEIEIEEDEIDFLPLDETILSWDDKIICTKSNIDDFFGG